MQFEPAHAGRLLRQLESLLRDDDARAEDVLGQLEALLAAGGPHEALTAIRLAVDEIEYHAALAPLATLARDLGLAMEEGA
jgi:hypothetical protein